MNKKLWVNRPNRTCFDIYYNFICRINIKSKITCECKYVRFCFYNNKSHIYMVKRY